MNFKVWTSTEMITDKCKLKSIFVNSENEVYILDEKLRFYNMPDYKIIRYTGIKDKNNNEIYSGDILELQDRIVVVVWDDQEARYNIKVLCYTKENTVMLKINLSQMRGKNIIIGNIFENPELFKKYNKNNIRVRI